MFKDELIPSKKAVCLSLPISFEKKRAASITIFTHKTEQTAGTREYIIYAIPRPPVVLLIMFILLMTVFMLSLIIFPATGISLAALNLIPLIARESALSAIFTAAECTPPNIAKSTPIPHVQKLFIKFITPERLMLCDSVFMADKAITDLAHGSSIFTDMI